MIVMMLLFLSHLVICIVLPAIKLKMHFQTRGRSFQNFMGRVLFSGLALIAVFGLPLLMAQYASGNLDYGPETISIFVLSAMVLGVVLYILAEKRLISKSL